MLYVTPNIAIPDEEIALQFARSSGPGGQNVNKVNTKVMLRWSVKETQALPPAVKSRLLAQIGNRLTTRGDLIVTSQRHRTQEQNLSDCKDKLRQIVLEAVKPPKVRKATRPSRNSVRRRLENKKGQSEKKQRRRPPKFDD